MTDEEAVALMLQVSELTEQVRVLEERNAQQAAYIQELQHRDPVIENQKKRQFAYVQRNGTERGAFDMLLVSGWKVVQFRRDGWKATVYVGSAVHELEPVPTQAFLVAYDNYLQGKLLNPS